MRKNLYVLFLLCLLVLLCNRKFAVKYNAENKYTENTTGINDLQTQTKRSKRTNR